MKFILGKKEQMTQIFGEDGRVSVGTVIKAAPLLVTQVKTKSSDGYDAVQLGFGSRKVSRLSKAVRGHIKKAGTEENRGFEAIKEYRQYDETVEASAGAVVDLSVFVEGDIVTISGISKGKGFQGVVKRHDFKGGRRSHGQKHSEREPGSIGAGGMQRVFKGKRMAGRMGSDRVTLKNVKVLKIDAANNTLMVSGAVPGRRGTMIEVRG